MIWILEGDRVMVGEVAIYLGTVEFDVGISGWTKGQIDCQEKFGNVTMTDEQKIIRLEEDRPDTYWLVVDGLQVRLRLVVMDSKETANKNAYAGKVLNLFVIMVWQIQLSRHDQVYRHDLHNAVELLREGLPRSCLQDMIDHITFEMSPFFIAADEVEHISNGFGECTKAFGSTVDIGGTKDT